MIKQLKQGLKKGQYIVYRDRKGRRRKFSSKIKLIAEVYSKRSKKRVGILNAIDKKTKRPVLRRFSTRARALHHKRAYAPGLRVKFTSDIYPIKYDNFVQYQIPNRFADELNDIITMGSGVKFSVKIYLPGKSKPLETTTIFHDKKRARSDYKEIIATMIISTLRDNRIRTSPKHHASSNPYWKTRKGVAPWVHYKEYGIELQIKTD